jgi:hypothetical protein
MADKTISYYDVVQEILKRVNDANGDIYLDRAKELVYEGISSLAVSDGVFRDDIRGILNSEDIDISKNNPRYMLKVKGGSTDLFFNPAKIISITDGITDQETDFPFDVEIHKYIQMSLSEINQLNDSENEPFNDEIFYYQRGDFIYFHPKDRMVAQKLVITYISEPDEYSYGAIDSGAGSASLERLYSLSFIYKVIDYGVGRIREQQGGE